MQKFIFLFFSLLMFASCNFKQSREYLYYSHKFLIEKDKVVQGQNVCEVVSSKHLKSNYRSPASTTFSTLIQFKLSINEKDNELPIGSNHWFIIDKEHESPIITFGEIPQKIIYQPSTFLPINYEYTFKVDVSPVLKQFDQYGFYTSYNGDKIAKNDFKGFYLAGSSEPLTWDFVNLDKEGLKLKPTDNPNIYTLTVILNPYNEEDNKDKEWILSEDISMKAKYVSQQPLVDALFNLSLEEARKNIEADSTLRTGAKWGGVWTRDVSYSTLLAFSYHEPDIAKISLRKKIKRGRIIQDTGSGGAWPVSSDRTTWVLAAWEIYLVTGDIAWLKEVYPIIKNSLEDDYKTIYDTNTGLYCGESSFLDWREQTYPKWMDNKDIYASQNLGTNVVHCQAHHILSEMARILGDPYDVYDNRAEKIKKGINDYLWMKDKGYYAQYRYGRNHLVQSPRFEALGEALAVLFGIADNQKANSIIANSPLTDFGATCIYPQIPDIPPYHNNGIWPFVQSYWNWAAAKSGNEAVLNHGLASIYRAGGLFLTNYENMVAHTGDFLGTEINSDRMLWSMAGNLAMVHRIFIGMDFKKEGLYFNPIVPKVYGGTKTLSNFKYRNTILSITVNGHGNITKSVTIDGKKADKAFIPNDWTGNHSVVIELANNDFIHQNINIVENAFTLPTVLASKVGRNIVWQPVDGVQLYNVYKNGKLFIKTIETQLEVEEENYASYAISAIDTKGNEGFMSEPIVVAKNIQILEFEKYVSPSDLPFTNYSGDGFVEITIEKNKQIYLSVQVEKSGDYMIDIKYSNGSGPWNTDNKCAIRSMSINDEYKGVFVFPQRGKDEWSEWGFSNCIKVTLKPGMNNIKIHFEDWNNNMNIETNTAMLDYLRMIEINK